jgi:hypothetical protein
MERYFTVQHLKYLRSELRFKMRHVYLMNMKKVADVVETDSIYLSIITPWTKIHFFDVVSTKKAFSRNY